MIRVLVCGGRDYRDADRMARELDAIHAQFGIAMVIHGGAPGADSLAVVWAKSQPNVATLGFYPNWGMEGRAAGPLRNARMLAEGKPDLVLAFPGGRGTDDMKRRARDARIPLIEVQ